MIVVINKDDLYVIAHFSRLYMGYMCTFRKDFVTGSPLQHIPGNTRSVYLLNDRQDGDVHRILRKLLEEKGSGYVFSEDLQRTYIIELIHFITRIHHQGFPLSANTAN